MEAYILATDEFPREFARRLGLDEIKVLLQDFVFDQLPELERVQIMQT